MNNDAIGRLLATAAGFHRNGDLARAEAAYQQVLASHPQLFDALLMMGIIRFQQRRLEEAAGYFDRATTAQPGVEFAWINRGVVLEALQRSDEALASYDRALAINPNNPDVLFNRSNVLLARREFEAALAAVERALALKPQFPTALNNRGLALMSLGMPDRALQSFEAAASLEPRLVEAWANKASALRRLRRAEEALAACDKAAELDPKRVPTWIGRGLVLNDLQRPDEALASIDRALALDPNAAEAHLNRGLVLIGMRRPREALAAVDVALGLAPEMAQAHINRAAALIGLSRYPEALVSVDRGLALDPNSADGHSNRGNLMMYLGTAQEALESFERAIAARPDHAEAMAGRARALHVLERGEEALAAFERVLAAHPGQQTAFGGLADAALHFCDWRRLQLVTAQIDEWQQQEAGTIHPYVMLNYTASAAAQLRAARRWYEREVPTGFQPVAAPRPYDHDRIRLAYLSADYRRHAMGYQIAELFELHDRKRFEVIGLSSGIDDGSEIRGRIATAFDEFIDIRDLDDDAVARLLREREVDILVDLMGWTAGTRIGILARRPCPVQVEYLGYPGSIGATCADYILADAIVLPQAEQPHVSERIVHRPHCYQVNDTLRRAATDIPSRASAGLPEAGFVFCSFNASRKYTPAMFDVWMRLLKAVDGSVLWLVAGNDLSRQNLMAEAEARGVAPTRLVFAQNVSPEDHLARHALADLFLDTLPYNAHGTASFALWAGLPIVTCKGPTFPGRVCASLLSAIGMSELIATSLEDYEALALRLARDAPALAEVRARLGRNRATYPLFDTPLFVRQVESAYTTMWQRAERGEPPAPITVPDLSASATF